MRLRTVALAAAGVAGAYALRRALLVPRMRPDPAELETFRLPSGVHHRYVPTSDGGSLHVVEHGSGRPVVLLHGITLSSMLWHGQLADLGDRYHLLAVDHRGHGESRPGSGGWTLARLAADLAELLDAFDLRGAVIVGHSMGGMVALRYAVDARADLAGRVAGLVLMSTSGSRVVRLAGFEALATVASPPATRGLRVAERTTGGLFPANDLSYLLFRLGFGPGASPAQIEMARAMTASTPVSAWSELMAGIATFDVLDRLREVSLPALVVVGSHDLLTPPALAERLAGALPASRLQVIDRAGHMPMLERRAEVSALIDEFARGLA